MFGQQFIWKFPYTEYGRQLRSIIVNLINPYYICHFVLEKLFMSKTLTLEIPDEVFSSFQKQAESRGETAEKFVLEIVLKNIPSSKNNALKTRVLPKNALRVISER